MKQSDEKRAALDAALARLELDCSDEQKELLLRHLELLVKKNEVLNLTRITSFEEAVVLHIEDSLSLLGNFSHSYGDFCDIGTGGGFPGLPLGIVSGRPGVLLDSVKKKAHAVQEFIDQLGLSDQLEARGMRSEELCAERAESFDTVVARAVASLNVVEELASPLLRQNGRLIAMKGIESEEEEKTALKASESLGFELIEKRIFEIGNGTYSRCVYVFEKSGQPTIKLPRRPGMATKRPLGL